MTKPREFVIADSITGDGILDGLRTHLALHDRGVREDHRTFLDTFDWRLDRGGHVVELVGDGGSEKLIWRQADGVASSASVPVDRCPRFTEDIPEGSVRNALAPILEMRALPPPSPRTPLPCRLSTSSG